MEGKVLDGVRKTISASDLLIREKKERCLVADAREKEKMEMEISILEKMKAKLEEVVVENTSE